MQDVNLAADFLHSVPPFNSLERAALLSVARKLEAAYYPRGKTILTSSPPPGLAVIRKGAVRLVDGEHKFLDKRSEGELFGHRIYFHGEQKEYAAEAEEDALIWHLGQDAFRVLRERNPLLDDYFSSHLQTRVRAAAQISRSVTEVRDVLKRQAVSVHSRASIRKAARLMSRENVSSVLVMSWIRRC
jgi:signal-transduction protein with cAMP-binding, CBS, and nucleotidyltransferase domain